MEQKEVMLEWMAEHMQKAEREFGADFTVLSIY
jgi:hypothetical protein